MRHQPSADRGRFSLKHTLLLVVGAGCATTQPVQRAEVQVLADSGWVASQSLRSATFHFDWQFQNPQDTPVTIRQIRWKLKVGIDQDFSGTETLNIDVAPGETKSDTLVVSVDLPYSTATLQYHHERGPLKYHMLADFELSDPEVIATTIQWHDKIFAPRAPRLLVEGSGNRGKRSTGFDFDIYLLNENPFPTRVDTLEYHLSVGGIPVATGELLEGPRDMPPTSEFDFRIHPETKRKKLRHQKQLPFELVTVMKMGELEQRTPFRGTLYFAE